MRTNTTTCARLLAYVTGLVNQELLLQNEYLAAENRILKARLQPGWRLSDGERATLAEIGKRLGRKGLEQVARLAKPDTILAGIADWWPKNSAAASSAARRADRALSAWLQPQRGALHRRWSPPERPRCGADHRDP